MGINSGTRDYDPIWRRQLREVNEKLEAAKWEKERQAQDRELTQPPGMGIHISQLIRNTTIGK